MKTEHPISITEELFEQWHEEWKRIGGSWPLYAATQAARWGADQELEACCADIHTLYGKCRAEWLRAHRRPKSPSLKEQALAELDLLKADATVHGLGFDAPAIRRALEALPDV